MIAIRQARKKDYQGKINATVLFADEVPVLQEAGADLVYDYHDGIGVGLASLSLEER